MVFVERLSAMPEFLLPLIPGSWSFGTDRNGFDGSVLTAFCGCLYFLSRTGETHGCNDISSRR